MLNSLFTATGSPARALKTSLRLALPFAIAIAASPAFAQISESRTPASPIPTVLPQVRETTGKWSVPASPPPNVIVLPGVTQADIDRVSAQPQRPAPNASAPQPATATAPLQPVPAQNRYVRRIPIYQGSTYQTPLTAATCSYSPSSTFSYQTFSDLSNRNLPLQRFPLQGYRDNTVVVTERTVTERTFVLNNSGLDRNQVIVSSTRYPQRLGRSDGSRRINRGSNRFDRLAECGTIERY